MTKKRLTRLYDNSRIISLSGSSIDDGIVVLKFLYKVRSFIDIEIMYNKCHDNILSQERVVIP